MTIEMSNLFWERVVSFYEYRIIWMEIHMKYMFNNSGK